MNPGPEPKFYALAPGFSSAVRYRRSLVLSPQQLHGGVFKDVLELFLQNLVELAAAAAAAAAAEAAKEKSFSQGNLGHRNHFGKKKLF